MVKDVRRRTGRYEEDRRGSRLAEVEALASPRRAETSLAIAGIVTGLGYECVNAALVTEDGRTVLRVMIDSLGGIDLGDCEKVSRVVERFLDNDAAGELGGRYYLEVSSPGVERPLFTPADYERFRGREARLRTHEPVEGRKTHVGFIRASDSTSVTLETERGTATIAFETVARASLVFRGLESRRPEKKRGPTKQDVKQENKANKEHEEEH
ncbi:MAG: ribosome maturation factor RimP [Synergistaceae bacterium]|nr:ribosome maturation factor RimP [Synergistaceae bacterium]